ncbi:GyrI-like domain-containing protein [Pseudonocardia sichuanensis]
MTKKIDFKRELDCYSARRDTPRIVQVPELRYLMVDGHGDPNTPAFAEATATLYPVAYRLKFASRTNLDRDYVVMPLEGLWWAEDMEAFTAARDKARWDWTLMIMTPDWITEDMVTEAVEQVGAKNRPTRLDDLRLEPLAEGLCVQALHIGSYDDEAGLLRHMHHEFIPGHGLTMVGTHHEIYLGDARRVEPAKLRTILRQPVAPTG